MKKASKKTTELALKFLYAGVNHLRHCNNVDCEFYWVTVDFLKTHGLDEDELLNELRGVLNE